MSSLIQRRELTGPEIVLVCVLFHFEADGSLCSHLFDSLCRSFLITCPAFILPACVFPLLWTAPLSLSDYLRCPAFYLRSRASVFLARSLQVFGLYHFFPSPVV